MKRKILTLTVLGALLFASCSNDDDNNIVAATTTNFRITLTNTINYLSTTVFNTPGGATAPGPLTMTGDYYAYDFYAYPGSKLSFVSMLANSNDWFFAPGANGIDLFDTNGNPVTGDVTSQFSLWDAGTEEENPLTIATEPGGATAGDPDPNNLVRVLPNTVSNYFTAVLSHDGSKFTMTITRTNTGIVTPGISLVHAQNEPFFTAGQPDRGFGLKLLAEAGMPTDLYNWFNETGSNGSPLRLSSSLTPFSPGVVYAFGGASDPLFTQGESVTANSGLEELSEDGNSELAYNYLTSLGLSADRSTGPILPGNSLSFEIEARAGDKLGFSTMFVQSNDWFVSFNNNGVELFNADGSPKSGTDYSVQAYLFDAGTEVDEAVGFGANQALRQSGPNVGAADANTTIRRVGEIDDVQFDKGMITSGPGVVAHRDARGGYNLIQVNIEPLN